MVNGETVRRVTDSAGRILSVVSKTVFLPSAVALEIAPAVAGKSIMVLDWDLGKEGGSTIFSFLSSDGSTDTAIRREATLTSGAEFYRPRNPDGWCQTYLGESLKALNSTGGQSLAIAYAYVNEGTARAPGVLNLADSEFTVPNSAGNSTFGVNRTGGTDGPVAVHYATANGSATAGVNYTAASGNVSFAAGASTAAITVAIITGGAGALTFTLTLTAPTNGATLGNTPTATVDIASL